MMRYLSLNELNNLNLSMTLRYIIDLARFTENHWQDLTCKTRSIVHLKEVFSLLHEKGISSQKRLPDLGKKLSFEMSLKHFLGIIVPFEREYARGVTDADLMIQEGDKSGPNQLADTIPLTVVLDNMRSAFNVGSIFRSAECVGVEKIYLCGYTATPKESKTKKTTMGTEAEVQWDWVPHCVDVLHSLRNHKIPIVAIETVVNSPSIYEFKFPEKCAFLLGNERYGLEPETLRLSDHIVHIPVYGNKNSLNVGVAFSVCAYELRRQRQGHQNATPT